MKMCFEGKERVALLHEIHGDAVGGDPAFAEGRVPVDHIKTIPTTSLYFRGRGVLLLNAGGQRHSHDSALPYLTARIKTGFGDGFN